MNRIIGSVVMFLMLALFTACGGSSTPVAISPGIEGKWVAPLQPSGSVEIELHPASSCSPNGPCQLTGTLKDNRNGSHGDLSVATLNGGTIQFHALLKYTPEDLTGAQYDFAGTFEPDELLLHGQLRSQGTSAAQADTWNVDFKKQ